MHLASTSFARVSSASGGLYTFRCQNIKLQNPQVLITLLCGESLTLLHSVVVSKSSEQYPCAGTSTSLLSSIIKLVTLLKIGQVLDSAPDSSSSAKFDIPTAVFPQMEVVYDVM